MSLEVENDDDHPRRKKFENLEKCQEVKGKLENLRKVKVKVVPMEALRSMISKL